MIWHLFYVWIFQQFIGCMIHWNNTLGKFIFEETTFNFKLRCSQSTLNNNKHTINPLLLSQHWLYKIFFALLFNWTNQKNLHFWSLIMTIHSIFNWMLESLCCLPREAIENFLRTLFLLLLKVTLMTHFFNQTIRKHIFKACSVLVIKMLFLIDIV